MAEIELKNKLITVDDVLKVGEILNSHLNDLKQQSEKCKLENEGKEYGEEFYRLLIGWSELKFSILKGDAKEERDDFSWFKNVLINDAEKISGISISYNCSYKENSKRFEGRDLYESFRMHLDCDGIGYGSLDKEFPQTETSQTTAKQIDNVFQNCKPRFDKTLQHRTLYRQTPSFAISGILAIIVSFVVFLATKISFLPEEVVNFVLNNPWILAVGGFSIMIVLGFVFPNSNMSLFKKIYIDKEYKSYDSNWDIEHYEHNYERFKNQTEFAVGRFYGSDKAREKIQKNFKISLVIIALAIVVLTGLTIALYLF